MLRKITTVLAVATAAQMAARQLDQANVNPEFHFDSEGDSALRTTYAKNNALTLFFDSGDEREQDFANVLGLMHQHGNCFEDELRFGHREDPDHASMHENTGDYERQHSHLIKGFFSKISFSEFNCVMHFIKEVEKTLGYCRDGKTSCLISHDDATQLMRRFGQFASPQTRSRKRAAQRSELHAKI